MNNTFHKVVYPQRLSEFEVQSDIYQELKKKGFNVKGEVKAKNSRLDIVVFDDNNTAKCIIEVKSRERVRKTPRKYRRVEKYEELFNLPVIVCMNASQVESTVKQVEDIFHG
jgi:hypothetical protein